MCETAIAHDVTPRCLIVRNGCRSIWCPRCGPGRGAKLRERLLTRYFVKGVGRVGFVTLTCSPKILGDELQSQFERVKSQRLVARFVRLFSKIVGRPVAYFSVMEFHKKSGQVHFHLALDDCGHVSRKNLAILQAWCQRNMGTFDYKHCPSSRAVRYCLKYLTKGAAEQLPDWCMDYRAPIRPFTSSRGFWHDGKKRIPKEKRGETRRIRTLRARFRGCEQAGTVGVEEHVDERGEVRRRFAFAWPEPFDWVRDLAASFIPAVDERQIAEARTCFAIGLEWVRELADRVIRGNPDGRAAAAGAAP